IPIYLGGSLELGNVWQTTDKIALDEGIGAASLLAGMDTLLGPLYIGLGKTENGDRALYFFLGQGF
ncbi:MAG TPA: hypothetical protein VGL10_02935, partial [Gammaproteobacteria bacterium]